MEKKYFVEIYNTQVNEEAQKLNHFIETIKNK
jgi:hypothetical protein